MSEKEQKLRMKNERFAALYARVSTDAQREEGYSIDAQKEMLEAYCKAKAIGNIRFYVDGGFSGANMQRPALASLIDDVRAGKIALVLVYKLDRLSRSQKDTLFLIEDVFNPNGVDFISLNENMDTSTPIGRAMLGIMSAFAQLERETIRERTRMGMKERVKSGLWPGGGKLPFGYDYNKESGRLMPNDDALIVKKAYDLLLHGYSPNRIAEILGLKYEKQAAEILRRRTNIGNIVYNGIEYKGQHEAIIDEATFDAAQKILDSRSRNRAGEGSHLLAGLIFCGKCGARMRYAKWGKKGWKLYCYSQQSSKPYLVHDPDCDNEKVWADEVEDAVIKDIFTLSLAEKGIQSKSFDEMAFLQKQKSLLEQKIRRLYDLYAKDADDLLLDTIKEIKAKLEQTETEIISLKEKSAKQAEQKETKKYIREIKDAWKFMQLKERQTVLRRLIEKINIKDGDIEIFYRFS